MLLCGEGVPQPSPGSGTRLKVFLDCNSTDCFQDYLREEVDIVDYVRDRNDADVHVLVTSAETVARGREYTLSFIGQGRFTAVDRQLTVTGVNWFNYYEETLYSKTEETLPRQLLATTYEQREPWGTLEGRVEWSNYLPGLSTHRVSVECEVDLRIARGLSLTFEGSASRIRDQLSLPRRDATPEEVLLRLRQLSSGFETRIELGVTYQFGSRFAAIVNPRFGQ